MFNQSLVNAYLRSSPSGERNLFPFSAPGFDNLYTCLSPLWYLTCLLGLQDVQ